MAPKPRFIAGEKVLCFDGLLLYKAKCLSSQITENCVEYLIHYDGWNKKWDKWVPESRVLKYNDLNLQKQNELSKTLLKAKESKSAKIVAKKNPEKETAPSSVPDKTLKRKSLEKKARSVPRNELSPEQTKAKKPKIQIEPCFVEKETSVRIKICINIPPLLKKWLLDDFDLVNRQKKILRLPARNTVDHIIANYVKEKVGMETLAPSVENAIVQTANKIRDTFNILLGRELLCKFERPQYAEILIEYHGLKMCQIYGAIHLLRMFTILGDKLVSVAPPGTDFSDIVYHTEDFVRYLSANPEFFSLDDYVVASSEYYRRSIG